MRYRALFAAAAMILACSALAEDDDLGNLSANPYSPDSTSNPYGAGNPYKPNSINNPYGKYGSEYSPNSVNNPYATETPKLYDSEGNYRGKLSSNKYDPESVSNPYGKYGNPYSPDSINNPYGAGSPYSPDSPNNPYGTGLKIVGEDQHNDDSNPYSYEPPDYSFSNDPDRSYEVDEYEPYDFGTDLSDSDDSQQADDDYGWEY